MSPAKKIKKPNYTLITACGFLGLIAIGSILLSLPAATVRHTPTRFIDCVFTSASAVCITGLTPFDIFTHWSLLGQIVIITLIQIGGLGFMTLISAFATFFKKSFSVTQKYLVMQSTGTMELGGLRKMLRKIVGLTFSFELIGAVILAFRFLKITHTFSKACYFGLFHSISAFCNAGFDLCGIVTPSGSLEFFRNDAVVNLTVCFLIIVGGLGFLVWDNILEHKLRFSKYDFHAKIVVVTTAALILFGTVFFFFSERSASMKGFGFSERLLSSFFQSVTLRTAGFSTVAQGKLSSAGFLVSLIFMAIGGAPGSTAGGIKVTTFAVFVLGMVSAVRGKREIRVFKRHFEDDAIAQASAVIGLFSACILIAVIIICTHDGLPVSKVLYESVSAAANVGLSASLTPLLSTLSKAVLSALMYFGRVGGFSLMILIAKSSQQSNAKRPVGRVLIG